MTNEIKNQFINDVQNLLEELYQINSFYLLNKYLKEKSTNSEFLQAMNKAPAFFQLTIHSFQYSAIMGLAKLFEPASRKSKNIFNFLNFIEANHHKIFSNVSQINSKLGSGNDIDHSTVKKHREQLEKVESIINNLISWRDKAFAHNDKKYFKSNGLISKEFPLTYKEIEYLIELSADILNSYQVAYNGNRTHTIPANVYDVDKVFLALRNF
ncbi:hypothetical protein RJD24_19480 [Bacillaceae bacterium IKA-2]|nr:hypothetical protein RJD24_19480 [Bacillaceae bacterium IKA-2]